MKKAIPVIISIIMISYFTLYLIIPLSVFGDGTAWIEKALVLLIPTIGLGFIAAIIYTLIIRLKEIDKEDKDDLSKY
ncbi:MULTISPECIES: hypothetical protein [unclassified Fusibacter]|uniref:hypothetical protein n=1 Tax=unclassified Fusibacter TaxID=2624464 RepID=UPI0010117D95|nr:MULTISPECIES: hypothetical protein [unclassified Fusibacter]MCK8058649.1 hypothetical protein [Fusibacter sp. A2]NPE21724.1 hypothetical protein [Fusibacter sp. A1]RXV61298.1 hypothetical protein DWB64_07755 [Fusibacter sp. A1]